MRIVDVLHELQGVDSQLEGAHSTLAQVQKEIGDRSVLAPLNQQLVEGWAEFHKIEAEQRDLELNAEGKRMKIASDDGKLYSGRVTSPKELESLSQEVQMEKHQLSIVEDRLLELLDASETGSKRLADLEAELARTTDDWNARQIRAKGRVQELEATITSLDGARSGLVGQLDGSTRANYDSLRRQKGGIAVATVLQRTCQACRVSSLTAALEQRARIGHELVNCPSCGRIIFVSLT